MRGWNRKDFLMPHMMIGDNFEILIHLPHLSHCRVVASDGVGCGTQDATSDLKHLSDEEINVFGPRIWFNVENLVHEYVVRRRVEWVLEYH
jgi:hypothetical protein